MSRNRLNPWPAIADLFAAIMVGGIAALVMTTLNAHQTIMDLQKRLTWTETQLQQCEAQLQLCQSTVKGCKSIQTPLCEEKGLKAVLFRATVLSRDQFQIGETVYSSDTLLEPYRSDRDRASEKGCVYRVELKSGSNLSGIDFASAVSSLRKRKLVVREIPE